MTSVIATDKPAFAPKLKPTFFIESKNCLNSALLYVSITSDMIFFISGFLTDASIYGKSSGNIELKCILPNVVLVNVSPETYSGVSSSENLFFILLYMSSDPAKFPTLTLIGVCKEI